MPRRLLLLLVLLAALAPVPGFAKALAPSKVIATEELVSEPAVDTTSQEVTEIVTTEEMALPPLEEPVKHNECADLIDTLGLKRHHDYVSEWSAFYRIAKYNPTGNKPADFGLDNNLGIRYKVPDKNGEYFQLAYEAAYNFWDGANANIQMFEFDVMVFACSSPLFRLKHHPYYGLGLANAAVNPAAIGGFNTNVFTVFGGVEFPGHRVDFDVFAKYLYGPDSRFNMDDLQLGLGVVYTFGRGR